jgi:hypothetical protein
VDEEYGQDSVITARIEQSFGGAVAGTRDVMGIMATIASDGDSEFPVSASNCKLIHEYSSLSHRWGGGWFRMIKHYSKLAWHHALPARFTLLNPESNNQPVLVM